MQDLKQSHLKAVSIKARCILRERLYWISKKFSIYPFAPSFWPRSYLASSPRMSMAATCLPQLFSFRRIYAMHAWRLSLISRSRYLLDVSIRFTLAIERCPPTKILELFPVKLFQLFRSSECLPKVCIFLLR